jgi:hypothetical protein
VQTLVREWGLLALLIAEFITGRDWEDDEDGVRLLTMDCGLLYQGIHSEHGEQLDGGGSHKNRGSLHPARH